MSRTHALRLVFCTFAGPVTALLLAVPVAAQPAAPAAPIQIPGS